MQRSKRSRKHGAAAFCTLEFLPIFHVTTQAQNRSAETGSGADNMHIYANELFCTCASFTEELREIHLTTQQPPRNGAAMTQIFQRLLSAALRERKVTTIAYVRYFVYAQTKLRPFNARPQQNARN